MLSNSSTTVSSAMFVTVGVAHLVVVSLVLGRVALVTGSQVRGALGQAITLPCSYSVGKYGKTEICWGQGRCTLIGCGVELIRTNGATVTSGRSEKYQLGDNIERGDVSLTIKHLREEDGGWYCCRVQISGLFNDVKVDLNLVVLGEITTPNPLTANESVSAQDANSVTSSTFEGTREILSSTITTNGINSTSEQHGYTDLPLFLGIGVLVLLSLTGIVLFIFLKKSKNSTKRSTLNNGFELQQHQAIEENIYQVS